jgi:hypothetical protein
MVGWQVADGCVAEACLVPLTQFGIDFNTIHQSDLLKYSKI